MMVPKRDHWLEPQHELTLPLRTWRSCHVNIGSDLAEQEAACALLLAPPHHLPQLRLQLLGVHCHDFSQELLAVLALKQSPAGAAGGMLRPQALPCDQQQHDVSHVNHEVRCITNVRMSASQGLCHLIFHIRSS